MNLLSSFDRLVNYKLATKRLSDDGRLAIYKYSKKVFFESLWGKDPLIAEARGIVLDVNTGEIVQYPLSKVYNYLEQNAGVELADSDIVEAALKRNGFMAAVCNHQGKTLITTTGSFDSPFVDLAKNVLSANDCNNPDLYMPGHTYVFEICDPTDKHIIDEVPGAYLIGIRSNAALHTDQFTEIELMQEYKNTFLSLRDAGNAIFGPACQTGRFGAFKNMLRTCTHEGWMIRQGSKTICKMKSPFYLGLKFLSRAHYFLTEDFDRNKIKQKVEEEFYPLIDYIYDQYGAEKFKLLSPEERVVLLRDKLCGE